MEFSALVFSEWSMQNISTKQFSKIHKIDKVTGLRMKLSFTDGVPGVWKHNSRDILISHVQKLLKNSKALPDGRSLHAPRMREIKLMVSLQNHLPKFIYIPCTT